MLKQCYRNVGEKNPVSDSLPFSQLNNNEFQTHIYRQYEIYLHDNEIERLRNQSFNPFLQSSHGKACLALNPDLDPDQNYYNQIMTHIVITTRKMLLRITNFQCYILTSVAFLIRLMI